MSCFHKKFAIFREVVKSSILSFNLSGVGKYVCVHCVTASGQLYHGSQRTTTADRAESQSSQEKINIAFALAGFAEQDQYGHVDSEEE